MSRGFEWPGSISEVYWCRSPANLGWSWCNGAGPRWGGRTGTTAVESALRALRFTTRVAACSGEWKATRRAPVAWAALGGAVCAVPLSGGRKAAAGVGHGAAHLLQLVADARKRPGVRAAQGQGGGDGEQGDIEALSRSTTSSEENDSVLKLFLNFTELDIDNALQVFDRMIWQAEKFSWSWDLVR